MTYVSNAKLCGRWWSLDIGFGITSENGIASYSFDLRVFRKLVRRGIVNDDQ